MYIFINLLDTKKGNIIAFATLEDSLSRIDVFFNSGAYNQYQENLNKDQVLVLEATIYKDPYSQNLKINAHKALTMTQVRLNFLKSST